MATRPKNVPLMADARITPQIKTRLGISPQYAGGVVHKGEVFGMPFDDAEKLLKASAPGERKGARDGNPEFFDGEPLRLCHTLTAAEIEEINQKARKPVDDEPRVRLLFLRTCQPNHCDGIGIRPGDRVLAYRGDIMTVKKSVAEKLLHARLLDPQSMREFDANFCEIATDERLKELDRI